MSSLVTNLNLSGRAPQIVASSPLAKVKAQAGLIGLWDFDPTRVSVDGGGIHTIANMVSGGPSLVGVNAGAGDGIVIVPAGDTLLPPNGAISQAATFAGAQALKATALLPATTDRGFTEMIVYRADLTLQQQSSNAYLSANGNGTSGVRSLFLSTNGNIYSRVGTVGGYCDVTTRFSADGWVYVFREFWNAAATAARYGKIQHMGDPEPIASVVGTTATWTGTDYYVGARSDRSQGLKGQIGAIGIWYGTGTDGLLMERATAYADAVAYAQNMCGFY